MSKDDIRWIQRLKNYQKALGQLEEAVDLMAERQLSNLEKQGLIQAYEFTHELAWNVLKDFLTSRGNTNIYGSRDATKEAFSVGIISNGDIWMDMIKSRNLTSRTYNEGTLEEIVQSIRNGYYPAFKQLEVTMDEFAKKELA
ncbi:nucleotidyltransferase [Desulfuribacillus stibiiarsenatis]|uniref:Nucleotidyltransferase n=1 Tax=Desulfuribacillus stibiiarsenatis TaxID=1390249 RepID=A0A1E5L5T2_9FIRM|nr:nucleotidyltransferase [Desulfuribacillus stibiiarsenatis]